MMDISATYALVSFLLRQIEMTQIISVEDQVDFMIMKHTTQMAIEIDPRSETDQTESGLKTED